MNDREGIVFRPSRFEPAIGYGGFDVRLHLRPSPRYFDACRAYFPVESAGVIKRQVVEASWTGGETLPFVTGRIRLEAHDGDHQEIYSFGGRATITTEDNATVCRVSSPAPFLPLSEDLRSPFAILESELEAIYARTRARWGVDEYDHLDRLGHTDPMTLFMASLLAVERRLEPLARADDEPALRQTLRLVRGIREQLTRTGEWPAAPRELEELL